MELIYPFGHIFLVLLELFLLFISIRLCSRSLSVAMIVLSLVLISISYDNLILGSGNFIGEGQLLKTLNMVRFLVHFLAVPLFIVVGVELAHRAGANWANTTWRSLSWVLAIAVASFSIVNQFIGLELVPLKFMGVLRYISSNPQNIPISTIIINIFVLLVGIGLWIRIQCRWVFIGSLISLIGNAIPSSIVGTLVGSTSEFLMALSLILTEKITQNNYISIKQDNNKIYQTTNLNSPL